MLESKGFIQIPILIIVIFIIGSVITGAFLLGKKSSSPLTFSMPEDAKNISIKETNQEKVEVPVENYNESNWQWLDSKKNYTNLRWQKQI